jgi:hypothetical protein
MEKQIEVVPVSKEDYEAYIEEIKARLLKDAPEWQVVMQQTSSPNEALWYHIARIDFSGGQNMTWNIPINTWVFAYQKHEGNGEYTYYKLNLHPLEHKLEEGTS